MPRSPPKRKQPRVELPHGASLDTENNLLKIPLGPNLVSLPVIQLPDLIELLDDIQTVLDMQSKMSSHECPTCGSVVDSIEYVSPDEGDGYN